MSTPPDLTAHSIMSVAADDGLAPEQRRLLEAVAARRNVFLTGAAGTGKSFLIDRVRRRRPLGTFVTASTGIAALSVRGTTLHSWAGLRIVDPETTTFAKMHTTVASNARACQRWRDCSLLIVDEVSMVDAFLLDGLDYVARRVRHRPDHAFGGVQVLLVGDFFRPVSRRRLCC